MAGLHLASGINAEKKQTKQRGNSLYLISVNFGHHGYHRQY